MRVTGLHGIFRRVSTMTDVLGRIGLGQWVMGVLGSIITVAVISMASSFSDMTTNMAVMKEQMKSMDEKIDSKMGDRYTGTEAKGDFKLRDLHLETLGQRLDQLGSRIDQAFSRLSVVERERRP